MFFLGATLEDYKVAIETLRPELIELANYQFLEEHKRPIQRDPYFITIDEDKDKERLGYA